MPAPASVWSSSRSSGPGHVWMSSPNPSSTQQASNNLSTGNGSHHNQSHSNGSNHNHLNGGWSSQAHHQPQLQAQAQAQALDESHDLHLSQPSPQQHHSFGAPSPYTPAEHPQHHHHPHHQQAQPQQQQLHHAPQHNLPIDEPGYPDWDPAHFHRTTPMLSGESPDFARLSGLSTGGGPAMLEPMTPELQAQFNNQLRSNRGLHEQCRTVYLGGLRSDLSYRLLLDNVRMKGVVLEGARILSEKRCAFITFVDPQAAVMFHAWCTIQAQNRDSKLNLNLASVPGHRIKVGWGSFHPVRTFILNAVSKGATRNVYLGNLDTDMDESFIHQHLERFGEIERIDVVPHKRLAFCHFVMLESAINAVTALFSDPMWNNRRIHYGRDRCSTTGGFRGSTQLSGAPFPVPLPGGPPVGAGSGQSPAASGLAGNEMGFGAVPGRLSPALPPQAQGFSHHGPGGGFQRPSSASVVSLPSRTGISGQRASFPLFQQQHQQQQQQTQQPHPQLQKPMRQSTSGLYHQTRNDVDAAAHDGYPLSPDPRHPSPHHGSSTMVDEHGNPILISTGGDSGHAGFHPEDDGDLFSNRSSLHSSSDRLSARHSFGARASTSTAGTGFSSRMAISGASSTVSGPYQVQPPDWHRGAVFSPTPIPTLLPRPSWGGGGSTPASRLSTGSSVVSLDQQQQQQQKHHHLHHQQQQQQTHHRQVSPPSRTISEEAEDMFPGPSPGSVGNPLGWSPTGGYEDLRRRSSPESSRSSPGGEEMETEEQGQAVAGRIGGEAGGDRDELRDSIVSSAVAAAAAATQTFNARNVVMLDHHWSPNGGSSSNSSRRLLSAAAGGGERPQHHHPDKSPALSSGGGSDASEASSSRGTAAADASIGSLDSRQTEGDDRSSHPRTEAAVSRSSTPTTAATAGLQADQSRDALEGSSGGRPGDDPQLLRSLSGLLRDDHPLNGSSSASDAAVAGASASSSAAAVSHSSSPVNPENHSFQMRASLPTPHSYTPSMVQRLGGLRASAPNVLHLNGVDPGDPRTAGLPPHPMHSYHYQQGRGSFVSNLGNSTSSESTNSLLAELHQHTVPGGVSHSTTSSSLQQQQQQYYHHQAGLGGLSGTSSVSSVSSAIRDPNHPVNAKRTVYMGNLTADQGGSAAAICSLVEIEKAQIESVRFMADKNCAFITFLDPKHSAIFHAAAVAVAASPQNLLSLKEQLRPNRSKRSRHSSESASTATGTTTGDAVLPTEGEQSPESSSSTTTGTAGQLQQEEDGERPAAAAGERGGSSSSNSGSNRTHRRRRRRRAARSTTTTTSSSPSSQQEEEEDEGHLDTADDSDDSLSPEEFIVEDDNLSSSAAHRLGLQILRDRSLLPVYERLLDIWRFVIPGKSLKVGWGTSNPKVIQAIHDAILNKGATRIICLMGVSEDSHDPEVITEDFSAFCSRWGGEIESIVLDLDARRVYTSFTSIRTAVRCFNTFLRPDWTTVGDYQSCSMQYACSVPKHAGTVVFAPHHPEPRRPQQQLLPHQHIQQQQQMQMLKPRNISASSSSHSSSKSTSGSSTADLE